MTMMNLIPGKIYFFKVSNRNTRKKCEICSKLTIKKPQQRQWRGSGVFIVNSKDNYFTHFSSVSIVDFEQVNVSWDNIGKPFAFWINQKKLPRDISSLRQNHSKIAGMA